MGFDVDVVVAVHDVRRAFARAVRSAFADDGGRPAVTSRTGADDGGRGGTARAERPRVRVTVVAHNLPASAVVGPLETDGLGNALAHGTVRVLELADGVPSPAGPFTLGLERAEAPWVSIMGSDDALEPGALAAWWRLGEARGSAAVLAPMRLDGATGSRARLIRNPVPRPFAGRWWPAPLDPVHDRLAARSAPLGLLRRDVVARLGLRLVPGLRTGEDIPFSARLWFSGERIDLDRTAPAYVIGTGAAERVSTSPKPVDLELAAVRVLRDEPWVESLGAAGRRALAVTMLRVHVLGAASRLLARVEREGPGDEAAAELAWLSRLARSWAALAPSAVRPLARADRLVVDALLAGDEADAVLEAARRRLAASRVARIVPARWVDVLDREGTLRRFVRERMWW